jgi:hypothetical protein
MKIDPVAIAETSCTPLAELGRVMVSALNMTILQSKRISCATILMTFGDNHE